MDIVNLTQMIEAPFQRGEDIGLAPENGNEIAFSIDAARPLVSADAGTGAEIDFLGDSDARSAIENVSQRTDVRTITFVAGETLVEPLLVPIKTSVELPERQKQTAGPMAAALGVVKVAETKGSPVQPGGDLAESQPPKTGDGVIMTERSISKPLANGPYLDEGSNRPARTKELASDPELRKLSFSEPSEETSNPRERDVDTPGLPVTNRVRIEALVQDAARDAGNASSGAVMPESVAGDALQRTIDVDSERRVPAVGSIEGRPIRSAASTGTEGVRASAALATPNSRSLPENTPETDSPHLSVPLGEVSVNGDTNASNSVMRGTVDILPLAQPMVRTPQAQTFVDTGATAVDTLVSTDEGPSFASVDSLSPLSVNKGDAKPLIRPDITQFSSLQGNPSIDKVQVTSSDSLEVHLKPEELGRIRISFSASETGLLVQISADRPEALDLMRRNIDLLQADLKREGLPASSFAFSDTESGHRRGGFSDANRGGSDSSKEPDPVRVGTLLSDSGPRPLPSDQLIDIRL